MSKPSGVSNHNYVENKKIFAVKYIPGWIYFILAGIFFLYEFFLRSSMGALEEIFRQDLGLGAASISIISSAYFFAYALMQIPAGFLLDRFGIRKMGWIAISTTAFGSLIFSISTTVLVAWIGRFVIGMGSAFAFVMMFKIILDWFPHERLGFLGGMTQVLGIIGPVLAGVPLIVFLQFCQNDWRQVFGFITVFGFVLAFIYWSIVRDNKSRHYQYSNVKSKNNSVLIQVLNIVKIKQLWFIALFVFFLYAPIEIIGSLFGIPLMIHHGFTAKLSAASVAFVWLGLGIGSPIVGYISDKLQQRKSILLFCGILGAISVSLVIWGSFLSITIYSTLFFIVGFSTGAQTLSFTLVVENISREFSATAVGFNNMFVILGAAIGQTITGIILHFSASSSNEYSLLNYQYALSFCIFLFLFSCIVLQAYVKETNCRKLFD